MFGGAQTVYGKIVSLEIPVNVLKYFEESVMFHSSNKILSQYFSKSLWCTRMSVLSGDHVSRNPA